MSSMSVSESIDGFLGRAGVKTDGEGAAARSDAGWRTVASSHVWTEATMPGNRAVMYEGPGRVEVHDIDYPTYELKDGPGVNKANIGRKVRHGGSLRPVATTSWGGVQNRGAGRTPPPEGRVLGHGS